MDHIGKVQTLYLYDGVIEFYTFTKEKDIITLIHEAYDSNDPDEIPKACIGYYTLEDKDKNFEKLFKEMGLNLIEFMSQGRHIDFVLQNYECVSKCSIVRLQDDSVNKFGYSLYNCKREGKIYRVVNFIPDGQHYTTKISQSLFEVGMDIIKSNPNFEIHKSLSKRK